MSIEFRLNLSFANIIEIRDDVYTEVFEVSWLLLFEY